MNNKGIEGNQLDYTGIISRSGFSMPLNSFEGIFNTRMISGKLYTIHQMNDVPNKCESCDAFDDCYMIGKGMKDFCKQEKFNAVYKYAFEEDND